MSTKIDMLCVGYLHGVATDSCSALQVISSSILSFRFPDLDLQIPFLRWYHAQINKYYQYNVGLFAIKH